MACEKLVKRIFIAIVIAIGSLSILHTLHTYLTCDGTVVRGLFRMECIKK